MKLSLFLAWRFLFSRHRSGFARLLTYLSVASVGLSLGSFVIVLGVMNGFDRDLQSRIVSSIGAVRGFTLGGVMPYTAALEDSILATPGVVALTPELRVPMMIEPAGRFGAPSACEVSATAVDISRKVRTSPIEEQLDRGSVLPDSGGILLGSSLAHRLGVEAQDTVNVVMFSPYAGMAEQRMQPAQMQMCVSGTFRTGYYEVDASAAILPVETVQNAFGIAGQSLAHSLEIAVSRPDRADDVAARLEKSLSGDGLYFRSWRQMREPLFKAVRLEKLVMALILSLFGLIAVFSVLSALTATAVEKRRELAALRAMGLTRRGTAGVIVTAGAIASGLGVLLGTALAATGHLLITRSEIFRLPSDIYDLDRLPSEWSTPVYAGFAAALFALSLLAALVPAILQARKSPSEALREE